MMVYQIFADSDLCRVGAMAGKAGKAVKRVFLKNWAGKAGKG